jgi:hypothetical protein
LSHREVQRSQVLQQVSLSGLTLKAGADLMKLSFRETQRLWVGIFEKGRVPRSPMIPAYLARNPVHPAAIPGPAISKPERLPPDTSSKPS